LGILAQENTEDDTYSTVKKWKEAVVAKCGVVRVKYIRLQWQRRLPVTNPYSLWNIIKLRCDYRNELEVVMSLLICFTVGR
jgi:hypothetical protein